MYNVFDYGAMIADQVRMGPYVEALRRYVNSDSIVLDIGTGTGIFALLACQLGARKVYAIEPNPAIQVAREIAAANGHGERIEFIEDLSTRVSLPEPASVMISDLRGVLPFAEQHLVTIIDARRRLCSPACALIPQKDILWAAVVTAAELYRPHVQPWDEYHYGMNLQAARRHAVNTWNRGSFKPEQFLVGPREWAQVDYTTVESADVSGELSWDVELGGTAHGLAVWFDTATADGIGFSNAPGGGAEVYGSAFFPWCAPVNLSPGNQVSVNLKATLVGDDYVWNWATLVYESRHGKKIKAQFQQSTFFAQPLSPQTLRKQSDAFVPRLNTEGLVDQFILGLMNDEYTQGEIASRVCEAFPNRFANISDALTEVAELSGKYSP